MTEPDALTRTAGPGGGPGGAPTAIALSPILSARYRSRDLERIRAAAPGARLVTVSIEGLADGPLDDVEVMLRGWLTSDAFDRLLVRAPHLSWVHSATSGVDRALTPASRERGLVVTNARGVASRALVVSAAACSVLALLNASGTLKALFEFLLLLATSASLWFYLAVALAALRLGVSRPLAALGVVFALATLWGAGIVASGLSLVLMVAGLPLYWWARRSAEQPV